MKHSGLISVTYSNHGNTSSHNTQDFVSRVLIFSFECPRESCPPRPM